MDKDKRYRSNAGRRIPSLSPNIGKYQRHEGQGILHTYLAMGEIEKAYESYKKHLI